MAREASAGSLQDLYFALGWPEDESGSVIRDFIHSVANGGLQQYKTIFQTDAKHGEPLYNHVLNMIFVAERLQPLLDLSDIETRVLYCAIPIHDLNKVGDRSGVSFNRLATMGAVKAELERISVPEFFPDYSNYLEDITLLVRSHSGHFHTDGEFLIRAHNPYRLDRDRLDRVLRPLIRALDNLELSHALTESTNKQDFLAFLNSITNRQYEFGYHQVAENRGILTNLVQNQVAGYLEDHYGLVPLLFYPEGIAYLVEKGHAPRITSPDLTAMGKRVAAAGARTSRGNFTKFIRSGNQGIKVDRQCLALGTSFTQILDYVYTLVMRKVSGKRFNILEVERKARERLELALTDPAHAHLHPHISDRLKTPLCPSSQEAMGAGELLRSYYIFLSDHLAKQAGDPWRYLYRWLKIREETTPFYDLLDPRYQRAYVITGDLGLSTEALYDSILEDSRQLIGGVEQPEDQALGDFAALTDYVTRNVTFSFETEQQIDFVAALQAYVESNHRQCCYCGSEFTTSSWMAQHVPADITVQSFSNRLPGGWGKEPKKNICLVCRAQFILEKLNRLSAKNVKTFYLHLYPHTFYTNVFLKALCDGVNDLLATDTTVVMLGSDDVLRETSGHSSVPLRLITRTKAGKPHTFGLALPQYTEFVGNVIIFPMNCPGDNDAEQFLFALQNVLVMQRFLGCKAVLTSSPMSPVSPSAVNDFDFFVDGVPLGFEGLLPEPDLDSQGVNKLWDRMAALIRLRSELYNPEREENSTLVLARAMADLSGLSVFHEADRMVEMRARSGGASSEQRMWRTISITQRILSNVNIAARGGPIMQALVEVAKVAWRDRIRGRSRERNSLLKPFDMILDTLKGKSDAFDFDTMRAALVEDIFRHMEIIAPPGYKPGRQKREKVKAYVDLFFADILGGVYRGNINRLLNDEKGLRSAYLFYVREEIPMKEREEEPLSVGQASD
jgi:CRISPR-associated protein Csc3